MINIYSAFRIFLKQALIIFLIILSSNIKAGAQQKPNVIFILGDDVGYNLLSVNGSRSYYTPNIDSMSRHGMKFTHCEGSPLCSPSRFMLLTGKYNFRNYSNWEYMNKGEKTFGNVMQDAGYQTGYFGKLQLQFSDSNMKNWGFKKYTVFELADDTIPTLRYKNPTLVDNDGRVPDSLVLNKYCDDVLTNRILNFIDSNSNNPFFVYYSMSIAHKPFCPTPEDKAFASWNPNKTNGDTSFFSSMISHMDMEVGLILDKLKKKGIDKNTLVIFAGDNGTPLEIFYDADDEDENIQGGKRSTKEAGTHVPLIAYWPSHISTASTNDDLIDFTDFLPTFADAAGNKDLSNYGITDGLSFYSRMLGIKDFAKQQLFMHYCPHPGFEPLKRWVRNKTYKLYDSTNGGTYKFYNIIKDKEEKHPLKSDELTQEEKAIKKKFKHILDSMPSWPNSPTLKEPFVKNITDSSAILGATVVSAGSTSIIDEGSNIISPPILPIYGQNTLQTDKIYLDTFSQTRHLVSEHQYLYSLYAMNSNLSHSTGYTKGKFYTLSAYPVKQSSYFSGCSDSNSILLSWGKAVFPAKGARLKGYAIFYSTDSIIISQDANGKGLSHVTTNASFLYADSNNAVSKLDTALHVTSLAKNTLYHFILIPFTWDGTTDSTYNYLTKGALTTTASISNHVLSLNTSDKDPLCFDDANGSIVASASNGNRPYLFQLNHHDFTPDSVFTNLSDGYYKVRVKDNNGCIDSVSTHLQTPAKLQLKLSIKNTSCDPDGKIIASAQNGTSPYLFSFNNGKFDTASQFNNLAKGIYTVAVEDNNKCIVTANGEVTSTLQNCKTGFLISPNPSNKEFKLIIGSNEINVPVRIKVFGEQGELVYINHGMQIPVYTFGSNFEKGVYFVKIETDDQVFTLRVIKE